MTTPTLHDLQQRLLPFREARDWKQFDTPRQVAAALAIEAGELQQAMLWKTTLALRPSVPLFVGELEEHLRSRPGWRG